MPSSWKERRGLPSKANLETKALPKSARKMSPSESVAIPEGSLSWPGSLPFTPHWPMYCSDGAGEAASTPESLGKDSEVAFEHPASATKHTEALSAAKNERSFLIGTNLTHAE